jgi:hypothetical protein
MEEGVRGKLEDETVGKGGRGVECLGGGEGIGRVGSAASAGGRV